MHVRCISGVRLAHGPGPQTRMFGQTSLLTHGPLLLAHCTHLPTPAVVDSLAHGVRCIVSHQHVRSVSPSNAVGLALNFSKYPKLALNCGMTPAQTPNSMLYNYHWCDTIATIQLLRYNCYITTAPIQLVRFNCCVTTAAISIQLLRYNWYDIIATIQLLRYIC